MAHAVFLVTFLCGRDPYAWPLNVPPVVTSSFGEYRTGRLHMGIDLHTGKNGLPVAAPEDGYVERVRCSPYGYGKALYLHLNDGHTVVFGHLQGFREDIAEYVQTAQHSKKNYTVDLVPEPAQFSFKRGEVLAKTGDTGIGPSHLHYEFRDEAEHPRNPKTLGVTWPDKKAPVIQKVILAPRNPESRINGGVSPIVIKTRKIQANQYAVHSVRVKGQVGFGVDLVDFSAGGDKLGAYRVRLLQGEQEYFRVQHDVLSYDALHCGAVAYHPYFLDEGRFLLLWRWPGNRCESFQKASSEGWVEVTGEKRELIIEVEDDAGNQATVTVPLLPEEAIPEPNVPMKLGEGKGRLECVGTYLAASVSFNAPECEIPTLTINDEAPEKLQRASDRSFQLGFAPGKGGEYALRLQHPRMETVEKTVHVFLRGETARTASMGSAQLSIAPDTPFGALFLWSETPKKSPKTVLPVIGSLCCIEPAESPLDTPATLSFELPNDSHDNEQMAIYRCSGNTWNYQETKHEQGRLSITTRVLGEFAVLKDDQKPVISNIVPNHGTHLEHRLPRIAATVSDGGSGLAEIEVTCGGQWLLMAYDPERNHLEWERDQDLPSGRQELRFHVTDKAGNTTESVRNIVVP